MKIIHIFPLSIVAMLAGCASPGTGQRVAIDSLATAGGGAAAYFASGKDPAMTTAGAVGGFVVSEAFQAIAKSGRQKAYNSGIEEGKAIGQEQILKGLWEESNGLPKNKRGSSQTRVPALMVPARSQNGTRYDSHTAAPSSVAPEKILVPTVATTNATSNAHYEEFQKQNYE